MSWPPQYSSRSDDGGARYSVQALILELEQRMRGKGANHMHLTGMDLAVTRTLLNHINKLEDRISTLEDQNYTLEERVIVLERRSLGLNDDGSQDNPYLHQRK